MFVKLIKKNIKINVCVLKCSSCDHDLTITENIPLPNKIDELFSHAEHIKKNIITEIWKLKCPSCDHDLTTITRKDIIPFDPFELFDHDYYHDRKNIPWPESLKNLKFGWNFNVSIE